MKIEIIKCLKDNYSYLIIDETNTYACVIDPSESRPIIKAIDTTAAGDSFNGSFLAYHLKNKHLSIEEKILSSHVITKNVLKYRGAIIPKSKMKI